MTLLGVLTMQLGDEVGFEHIKGVKTTFMIRFEPKNNQESGDPDS